MCIDITEITEKLCAKRDLAIETIQDRLRRWLAFDGEGMWIRNEELKDILSGFNRKFVQHHSSYPVDLALWDCALCQIIDLDNKSVKQLLPYLLTAYVYNTPTNKFLSTFLEPYRTCLKKYRTKNPRCIIAADQNDVEWLLKANREYGLNVGIGHLLIYVEDNTRARNQIKRLSQRFSFPPVKCHCPGGPYETIILPERYYKATKNYYYQSAETGNEKPIAGRVIEEYRFYQESNLTDIFCMFCSLSEDLLTGEDKPDFFENYLLYLNDIQYQSRIDEVFQQIEKNGLSGFTEELEKTIRSYYAFLTDPTNTMESSSANELRGKIRVESPDVPKSGKTRRSTDKRMRYSQTFKEKALERSDEYGVQRASSQLGIPYHTLANWRKERKRASAVSGRNEITEAHIRDLEQDVERLRQENEELREEMRHFDKDRDK